MNTCLFQTKMLVPMRSTLDRFHCIMFFLISGRIKAAQLEYSDAHKHLLQALRKAPTHGAVGFKQTVSPVGFKLVTGIKRHWCNPRPSLSKSFFSKMSEEKHNILSSICSHNGFLAITFVPVDQSFWQK